MSEVVSWQHTAGTDLGNAEQAIQERAAWGTEALGRDRGRKGGDRGHSLHSVYSVTMTWQALDTYSIV